MILIGVAGQRVPQPTTQGHVRIQSTQIKVPFFFKFPNEITSVFSLVFSIFNCILNLVEIESSHARVAHERRRESLAFRRRSLSPSRVIAHLAFLATRNGELVLRILYSWHFSQYISNDIHAKNVSLVDDSFFS